jgi:uncharacterized coiled-coil protein SlyX
MSVDVVISFADCEKHAQDALTEIRACCGEIQTFMDGEYDRLDALADELLIRHTVHEQAERRVEQELIQNQMDRLVEMMAEVAETVAEQKQLGAKRNRRD